MLLQMPHAKRVYLQDYEIRNISQMHKKWLNDVFVASEQVKHRQRDFLPVHPILAQVPFKKLVQAPLRCTPPSLCFSLACNRLPRFSPARGCVYLHQFQVVTIYCIHFPQQYFYKIFCFLLFLQHLGTLINTPSTQKSSITNSRLCNGIPAVQILLKNFVSRIKGHLISQLSLCALRISLASIRGCPLFLWRNCAIHHWNTSHNHSLSSYYQDSLKESWLSPKLDPISTSIWQ